MEKWKVRKKNLLKRDRQLTDTQKNKSCAIFSKIFGLEIYKKSTVVMCYMDFRNEVITTPFIKEMINSKKRIAIPKMVQNKTGGLDIKAFFITDIIEDLKIGKFSIREPKSNIFDEALESEIDLAVVPGIAFDKYKNRIGYGKGYYDRYFRNNLNYMVKIGVAYDFQIVDYIESSDVDVKMDTIVTEKRIIF
jgi:5-formyltetrahydrofolate cyclo-ligase